MSAGQVTASRILRKLAAYPRRNDLAAALREVGRRTLFIIEWILEAGMRCRAQVGLNKGKAHHALKNALRIGRQGEIRDRTTESQHYRIAGLNLLTAIIVYWNTLPLGHAVEARRREGLDTPDHLLAHILLTGDTSGPRISLLRVSFHLSRNLPDKSPRKITVLKTRASKRSPQRGDWSLRG